MQSAFIFSGYSISHDVTKLVTSSAKNDIRHRKEKAHNKSALGLLRDFIIAKAIASEVSSRKKNDQEFQRKMQQALL